MTLNKTGSDFVSVNGKSLQEELNDVNQQLLGKVNKSNFSINALDYGVINDGITDNSLTLKNLLDSASGKAIYFPSGVYKIDSEVMTESGVRIFGDGDSTIFDLSGGG